MQRHKRIAKICLYLVNQKQEIPRLCRGDSRCLTYSGVHQGTDVVSRQAHDEGGTDGRGIEPKIQQVGVQISQVFILKCRRKVLYGQLRNDLGEVFRA